MNATDPRYHVGLGIILENFDDQFSFDRSASLADLWQILFWNLIRHPIKTIFRSKDFMPGAAGYTNPRRPGKDA